MSSRLDQIRLERADRSRTNSGVCRELKAGRDQSEAGPSSQSPGEGEREREGEGQTVIRMTPQGPRKLTLFHSERE